MTPSITLTNHLGSGKHKAAYATEENPSVAAIIPLCKSGVYGLRDHHLFDREVTVIQRIASSLSEEEQAVLALPTAINTTQRVILMPRAQGDLNQFIKSATNISADRCARIMRGILRGLTTLHEHNILHADLKGDNVLIFGEECKIADFGQTRFLSSSDEVGFRVGGPKFRPPEGVTSKTEEMYRAGILFATLLDAAVSSPDNRISLEDTFVKFGLNDAHRGLLSSIFDLICLIVYRISGKVLDDSKKRADTVKSYLKNICEQIKGKHNNGALSQQEAQELALLLVFTKNLLEADPSQRLSAKEAEYIVGDIIPEAFLPDLQPIEIEEDSTPLSENI